MENHKFGRNSERLLADLHGDAERVCRLALKYSKYDFGISEVKRTKKRQAKMVEYGKSWTMSSRHIADNDDICYGVDIYAYIDGKANYDKGKLRKIAGAFFRAAIELGIDIEWGGHWETVCDMPHFQLSRRKYPGNY